MTIRMTIKNEDSRETAVVEVKALNNDLQDIPGTTKHILKGGESCEIYVHSHNNYFIKEIRNG